MNQTDSTKAPTRRLTPKRVVVALLLAGLVALYISCAIGAVAVGGFAARESGGVHGFGLILTAIIGGAFVLVIALSVPRAAHGGAFEFGDYAAQQPWILLGVCLAAAVTLAALRARRSTWGVALPTAYALAVLTTNYAADWFRVDHSQDFPVSRAIDSLDWRDNPTEDDVIARAGQPLARKEFGADDPALPDIVSQSMRDRNTTRALILAYYEAESFGRVSTHYVILDPATKRIIARVSINVPVPTKWPNHALQRTAPRVTLAASSLRLSPITQPAHRAPQSLSLGSLGRLARVSRIVALCFL